MFRNFLFWYHDPPPPPKKKTPPEISQYIFLACGHLKGMKFKVKKLRILPPCLPPQKKKKRKKK